MRAGGNDMLSKDIIEQLAAPEGKSARMVFCGQVAGALQSAGRSLWAFGLAHETPEREALAIVVQIAADLANGAIDLYGRENWYAGAALVRQLIEAEYLLFLFAHDADEAVRWRQSTANVRKTFFSPAKMRERSKGRFRWREYGAHCDYGGHPTPAGHILLAEHPGPFGSNDWLWSDLAQHLERLWSAFDAAVSATNNSEISLISSMRSSFADWRATLVANDPCHGWFEFNEQAES